MVLGWDASWIATRHLRIAAAALLAGLLALIPTAPPGVDTELSAIVRFLPGHRSEAIELVEQRGGEVTGELAIIDAITAELPARSIAAVRDDASIRSVTENYRVQLQGWDGKESKKDDTGKMEAIRDGVTHASQMADHGYDGAGVDVALIDSGVVPVNGFLRPGKVVNGPDLSFESQYANLRHLDSFGHGTHLAGIIAGADDEFGQPGRAGKDAFAGMATGARIVNVKVADANGAADVSQVIAAIDWVVQHRNDNGLNIRVLNLSFGTNSTQDYRVDPLAYAAEVAWRNGIVVVVAAGNDGAGGPLRNPAYDPYVIAVGANASQGTGDVTDDVIPEFSSCGTAQRHVDLVAPGKSIISTMSPGSSAHVDHPDAVVADRFMKGSGTSQAAAVVAGAAAVLIQQRPGATPDQIKALLTSRAVPLPGVSSLCQGAGTVTLKDLHDTVLWPTPVAIQTHDLATGTGSLEAARGTDHIELDEVELEGEQDIFGNAWDGASWSTAALAGASWSGGTWNGASWSGASWSGASWSGASWSGASWSSDAWTGESWSDYSWSGASWSGASWSGASWSGASWSGASWSTGVWLGLSWKTALPEPPQPPDRGAHSTIGVRARERHGD